MNTHSRRLILTVYFFLGYLLTVTSAAAQTADIPPVFSVSPGFYDEPVSLALTHPVEGVEIWYTTDGSNPVFEGEISQTATRFVGDSNQLVFVPLHYDSTAISGIRTNPIETDSRGFGWKPSLYTGYRAFVIRTVAVLPSGAITRENHGTWFIGTAVPELPVISILAERDDLFGDERGIYVPGDIYNENGYGPNYWGFNNANYHQRGEEWERVAQFEYYVDGKSVLGQQVGLRIHGGGSRALPMKSLRVYARSEYGVSTLDYPFLGPDNDDRFKRLILRNSGQDFAFNPTMIRDGAIQQVVRSLNVLTQDFQPALVYINGEYWGIHNIRERYDHHYFERTTGIVQEDLDFLTYFGSAQEGDDAAFNELVFYFRNLDMTKSTTYQTIGERLDIQNFIDYKLLNIHFVNIDWPGNNIDYFRYRGDPVPGHPYKDGRFRYVVYDMDAGFEHVDKDMLTHSTEAGNPEWPNPDWSTLFLRKLLENEHFKGLFIQRYVELLNSTFQPDNIIQVVDERQQAILGAMPGHIERWGYPESMARWNELIQRYRQFAVNRREIAKTHLESFFDIEILDVRLFAPEGALHQLLVNGMPVNPNASEWHLYHQKGEPLTVQVISAEGYQFSGWRLNGDFYLDASVITLQPESDIELEMKFNVRDTSLRNELLHFWYFDESLPNDTPLYSIESWYSTGSRGIIEYVPALSSDDENYPDAGIMDRVNDPTDINFLEAFRDFGVDPDAMRGVRVRNPSVVHNGEQLHKAEVIFSVPSSGFTNVSFSFAANRTVNGQEFIRLWYATDSARTWQPYFASEVLTNVPQQEYSLFNFDFSDVPEAGDNEFFALRLTFSGDTATEFEGNVRLNNIALHGNNMSVSVENPQLPTRIQVLGNYPNPFNPSTTIRYHLPSDAQVRLNVFDILGRQVATLLDERIPSGTHHVVFDAGALSSGVYVYQFIVDGDIHTGKMLLIR